MTNQWINDGGHGGKDPGACANGHIEKVYTLEAATYVNKRLAEHGISSGLTRTGDETLEQSQRTAKVKASLSPYGLSHHYNAGGGEGAEFIHSIHSSGQFEHTLAEEFKNAGYPVRRVFCKKGKNNKDYYYMHRETGYCRMTIIEYDFLDGDNAPKLKDKSYREGMYECVVKAVCRQEEVAYKPIKEKLPEKSSLYRVQVGAFSQRDNAERLAEELKKKGYAAIVTE